MSEQRAPLGAGVVALIVVDALLLLVFAVLLFLSLPSGRTGAEAPPTVDPTPTEPNVGEAVVFASPTRNITCSIREDAANCEIAHFMYQAPTLAGCEGSAGHEIEVTAEGARWVCRTGSPPPTPSAEIADLPWARSTTAYGFTCTSEGNGVTCRHDESGHSFSLARREYSLG